MAVAVDADGMALCGDAPGHLGMPAHILSHQEKGGLYVPRFQDIQNRVGIFF